ncbi:hypothetical protein A2U01_0005912 [Trifolium medium]|uniref:Retrotransposon gag domain-containing protein n=1 Tax=Trifolium medium TaxID=97028 RepID=A0A392MC26_9FABA|nr:hypothetical protein [Trifolium medium]
MIFDPPPKDSGKSHASVSLQKTNLSKKAPAAIGKSICAEQQQELKISATDFQKLIDSLDDHKALIREQRELLLEQSRRLDSLDKTARHSQYEDANRLQQVSKKRGRTPPRKDRPILAAKRGKGFTTYMQRPPSPRHARQTGGNPSTTLGDRGKRHMFPTPPRQERRSRSPPHSPREDSSPNYEAFGSDEEENYGPLSLDILNAPLPAGLERPPKLPKYDGQGDPDEHISVFNVQLDYQRVSGRIKCRLFSTTLTKRALDWYKALPRESIHSWTQLAEDFKSQFTASRRPPKTLASLEAVVQRDNESLRDYIERINSEAIQVNAEDSMKRYLIEKGLRRPSEFAKALAIEPASCLNHLLKRANAYIKYEEKEAVANTRGSSRAESSSQHSRGPPRGGDKRHDDRPREKGRGPQGQFTNYTPLNATREHIYAATGGVHSKTGGSESQNKCQRNPTLTKQSTASSTRLMAT